MVYLPDKTFSLVFSKINDMCSDLALTSSVLSLFGLVAFDEVGQASLADRALTARRQALVAEELTGCLVCTAIRYTMC